MYYLLILKLLIISTYRNLEKLLCRIESTLVYLDPHGSKMKKRLSFRVCSHAYIILYVTVHCQSAMQNRIDTGAPGSQRILQKKRPSFRVCFSNCGAIPACRIGIGVGHTFRTRTFEIIDRAHTKNVECHLVSQF
jgi:hypothetical protein